VYSIFLLLLHTSSGFDITDESFYILTVQHQGDVFSIIRHGGYYTRILYYLSGQNLSYFRLMGIFILISTAIWFAFELHKYIIKKFNYQNNFWDKLLFTIPLAAGALSYYRWWIITPSYNWLALISIILTFTLLLRIINNKESNYTSYVTLDYILLSFSLSISFMAKPTTAFILMFASVLFAIYEFKNINLKKAILSVSILTIMIVAAHFIVLYGSLEAYHNRLMESMKRMALLDDAHTFNQSIKSTIQLAQEFFFEKFYFHEVNHNFFYGVLISISTLFAIRKRVNALNIYLVMMFTIITIYTYFMFIHGFGPNFRLLWFRSIELLLLNLILTIFTLLFIQNKKHFLIQILKVIPLFFILLLGSLAYKFGTNNNIIHAMSSSTIFVISAILILDIMLDHNLHMRIFTAFFGLIISIFIYHAITYAYKHPYRLISGIKEQNHKVALLGGLKVDSQTKRYIENLQQIANNFRKIDERISLIDMTGASPGANIILNADFFGRQWLTGGYKNSNQFVQKVLTQFEGSTKLKKAWILIAPEGNRRLNLNILNKVGLDFPSKYQKIGIVKTGHRNEIQELWIPQCYNDPPQMKPLN